MTYRRIFDLKFKQRVPTHELKKRFPRERHKISRIALLELPLAALRETIKEKSEYQRILELRRSLLLPIRMVGK